MPRYRQPGRYAIVTALSPNLWDDYLVFYDSIRRYSFCEIFVIGLELTEEQEEHIKARQFNVLYLTPDQAAIEEFKTIDSHWRQWYKPYLIGLVQGVDHLLWLDVDMVILGDLSELFAEAAERFFVIADYFAPKSCINDAELYEAIPAPVPPEQEEIALNSGVIGFSFPRDQPLLERWLHNVKLIHQQPDLKKYVKLYDQGVLLLTLRQLGMVNAVQANKAWNYPAKKNPYEMATPSKNPYAGDFQWPQPHIPRIGGDIHDNIRLDNPDALIAHYAGLPKLHHLCEVDNNHSIVYYNQKHRMRGTKRVFVVGLERAGTHTVAEILRRSSRVESWVRHEHKPALAYEAWQKHCGKEYKTEAFTHRLKLFSRTDCGLVCEANHRLGFFIDDIYEHLEGRCKFIFLIRDPVDLIRSRLLNFAIWPDILHKYPGSYQMDYYALLRTFGPGSVEQNQNRIRPSNYQAMDILDLHLWEVRHTIHVTMSHLKKLPDFAYRVFWLKHLEQNALQLNQFIGENIIELQEARRVAGIRFGGRQRTQSEATLAWVEELVNDNQVAIGRSILDILLKYGIRSTYVGV